MNIFLLAAFVAATQAATPFQWEFDFRQQCGDLGRRYQCFVGKDGGLTNIGVIWPHLRNDYQTHPHVVAISPQSPNRWAVVMQTRSNSKKVDLLRGMGLVRYDQNKKMNDFIRCGVTNGTFLLTPSSDIETELIDFYFDDHHLYCDFIVKPRQGSGKNLLDIVSIKDRFILFVNMDGEIERFEDEYNPNGFIGYGDKRKYISTFVHETERQQHGCDLSKVKFDPTEALTWGKVRQPEYFGQRFFCPDSRYALHVTSSNGKKKYNAELACENVQYQISDSLYGPKEEYGGFKVDPNETINVVCYVQDKLLCPISIPCYKDKCPYVEATVRTTQRSSRPTEYRIDCENFDIPVMGEGEHRFKGFFHVTCEEHNLVLSKDWNKWVYTPPNTKATVGYCERKV